MFYRVTKTSFNEDRREEILAWGESVRARIEEIDGLLFVDTFDSGPGESIIVAAYESEEASNAASGAVMSMFAEMGQFLTSAPQTYSGTVDQSFKR